MVMLCGVTVIVSAEMWARVLLCPCDVGISCLLNVCRVPSRTWKPGKPGDFNLMCPVPEIAWNLLPQSEKT